MTNHMIKVATTETQYTISDLKASTQYRFVLLKQSLVLNFKYFFLFLDTVFKLRMCVARVRLARFIQGLPFLLLPLHLC